MSKRCFSTESYHVQSVQGLHRLHLLTISGMDESPEAEAVRASLEGPWQSLTDVEQQRITGLSEDLYSISEPALPPLSMNPQAQKKLDEAYEARRTGEWDTALCLLRQWGRYLAAAPLAYLRGCIWKEAGDAATAALFFEKAAQLEPAIANCAAPSLDILTRSDPTAFSTGH